MFVISVTTYAFCAGESLVSPGVAVLVTIALVATLLAGGVLLTLVTIVLSFALSPQASKSSIDIPLINTTFHRCMKDPSFLLKSLFALSPVTIQERDEYSYSPTVASALYFYLGNGLWDEWYGLSK